MGNLAKRNSRNMLFATKKIEKYYIYAIVKKDGSKLIDYSYERVFYGFFFFVSY